MHRGGGGGASFARAQPNPLDAEDGVDGTGSISGYAFFDSNDNGVLDQLGDWGIHGLDVQLTSCFSDGAIDTTTTNTLGHYQFNGLSEGAYRLTIPEIPTYYQFFAISDKWVGGDSASDSAINPATGSSACFMLVVGSDTTMSFATTLAGGDDNSPSLTVRPTGEPAPGPTGAPSVLPTGEPTPGPTGAPSVRPTGEPTPGPTGAPSRSPTSPPSRPPSSPPSLEPTKRPTLSPTPEPSSRPSAAGTHRPSGAPTEALSSSPSAAPSPVPSSPPSSEPSIFASSAFPSKAASEPPSLTPTATARPTSAPSASPSRAGQLYGPLETDNFVMVIRGIEQLEELELWQDGTSKHIMNYYRSGRDPGAFDVAVSLEVTKQKSSNPTLFQERRWLRDADFENESDGGRPEDERRRLQPQKSVDVTFSMTASFKSPNFAKYDFAYVATQPFNNRKVAEQYMRALKNFAPYYQSVTSVGSIRVDPPTDDDEPAEEQFLRVVEEEGLDKRTISIIVAVCGAFVLVVYMVVVVAVKRRRAKRLRAETRLEAAEMEEDLDKYEEGMDEEEEEEEEGSRVDDDTEWDDATDEEEEEEWSRRDDDSEEDNGDEEAPYRSRKIVVVAPAGKLGVVVVTPPGGGTAYVRHIKDGCPIADQIQLDDRVLAVDDEDVRGMSPSKISRLLARKSHQKERKIAVERRVAAESAASYGEGFDGEGSDGEDSDSTSVVGSSASSYSGEYDSEYDGSLFRTIDVVVPAGKLGLVLDSPFEEEGAAYVCEIKDDCPVADQIQLEDEIVAVDGEDVLEMDALEISRLLAQKSRQPERRITVERRVGGADGTFYSEQSDAESDTLAPDDASEEAPGLAPWGASTRIRTIDILLPAGNLGIVLDAPPDGGTASVCEIKDDSPVSGQIRLGDKILAVDDELVLALSALEISRLLASRSRQPERRITVERRVGGAGAAPYREEYDDEFGEFVPDDAFNETPDLALRGELTRIQTIDVLLPAGKLGIVLDAPPGGGTAYVCEVKDDCPVADQVQLGDKILIVDDKDVLTLGPLEISQLLASKNRQPERRIMVSRRVAYSESDTAGAKNPYLDVDGPAPMDDGLAVSLITLDSSTSSLHPIKENSDGEDQRLDLVAPSGRLGVMLERPEPPLPPGPAYVFNIREDSPLKGKARFGDKILAVDDEDVTEMSAINISMLLGKKSSNEQRKITILREARAKKDEEDEERRIV